MSYLALEQELQSMVGQGQLLEAFDKFYADDVVMEEPRFGTTEGKQANRKRDEAFVESIKEMHGGGIHAMASNEETGVTMTETWMDATYADGNRVKFEQVSVKHWKDGKVVKERFYYTMPG